MKEFILKHFIVEEAWDEIEQFIKDMLDDIGHIYFEDFESIYKLNLKTFASFPCYIHEFDGLNAVVLKTKISNISPNFSTDLNDKLTEKQYGGITLNQHYLFIFIHQLVDDYDYIYDNKYFTISLETDIPEFSRTPYFFNIPLNQLLKIFNGDFPEEMDDYFTTVLKSRLLAYTKEDLIKFIEERV